MSTQHRPSPEHAAFYFDLASPDCYLAGERVLTLLPRPLAWRPVLARSLSPSAERLAGETRAWRAAIAARAAALGLQPLRWPEPYPFDSELAMLAATYAESTGRVVAYSQAAFRQAFAGGRSLSEVDHVLIAAAACELHPAAVLAALERRSVRERLAAATAQARRQGIRELPAVALGGAVFQGAGALERAAAHAEALHAGARRGCNEAPAGSREASGRGPGGGRARHREPGASLAGTAPR